MSDDPVTHHVLVVDDDPGLLRAIAITLRTHGWRVSTATSGGAGIDLVATDAPDVILLDLGLPDMTGLNVARELRARPATREVPIVALTGRALESDRIACVEAGCSAYMAKPVDSVDLLKLLRELG